MANDPRFEAYLAPLAAQAGLATPLPIEENRFTLQVGSRGVQLLYSPADDVVGYAAALYPPTPPDPRRVAAFNLHRLFGGGHGLFMMPGGGVIFFQRRPRPLVPPDALLAELASFRDRADAAEQWCLNAPA